MIGFILTVFVGCAIAGVVNFFYGSLYKGVVGIVRSIRKVFKFQLFVKTYEFVDASVDNALYPLVFCLKCFVFVQKMIIVLTIFAFYIFVLSFAVYIVGNFISYTFDKCGYPNKIYILSNDILFFFSGRCTVFVIGINYYFWDFIYFMIKGTTEFVVQRIWDNVRSFLIGRHTETTLDLVVNIIIESVKSTVLNTAIGTLLLDAPAPQLLLGDGGVEIVKDVTPGIIDILFPKEVNNSDTAIVPIGYYYSFHDLVSAAYKFVNVISYAFRYCTGLY